MFVAASSRGRWPAHSPLRQCALQSPPHASFVVDEPQRWRRKAPGGAAGLQNQSGGRKVPGGFDSLPSPPRPRLRLGCGGQGGRQASGEGWRPRHLARLPPFSASPSPSARLWRAGRASGIGRGLAPAPLGTTPSLLRLALALIGLRAPGFRLRACWWLKPSPMTGARSPEPEARSPPSVRACRMRVGSIREQPMMHPRLNRLTGTRA